MAPLAGSKRKRSQEPKKVSGKAKANSKAPTRPKSRRKDEEISESDDEGLGLGDSDDLGVDEMLDEQEESEDDLAETPAQKRLRLAQAYIEGLEKKTKKREGDYDAEELDRDLVADRLIQDSLETSDRFHIEIASKLSLPIPGSAIHTTTRPRRVPNKSDSGGVGYHRLPVTSAVVSQDGKRLFTADKDGKVICWKLDVDSLWPTTSTNEKQSAVKCSCVAFKRRKQDTGSNRGHTSDILTLSLSQASRQESRRAGTALASGGKDGVIGIWDVSEGRNGEPRLEWVGGLKGHKGEVTSLAFRPETNQLYSTSIDRTVKIHSVLISPPSRASPPPESTTNRYGNNHSLSYLETLFGHQDAPLGISVALPGNEVALTVGGRDLTARWWKVAEETQLVFRGGGKSNASKLRDIYEGGDIEEEEEMDPVKRKQARARGKNQRWSEGSLDCVAMIDRANFLTGGDSGTISLWSTSRKKPAFSQPLAHGLDECHSETEGVVYNPRWIVSIACLKCGDIFASGSWDGFIRLWKLDAPLKSFSPLVEVPIPGFVNALQLIQPTPGDDQPRLMLVAGIGQEHRMGRWKKIQGARNQALIICLQ